MVGDRAITEAAIRHWTAALSLSDARERSPQDGETPRQQAVSFLITSSWLVGEAHRLKLGVSEREVSRAIMEQEHAYDTRSEFAAYLKSAGRVPADLRLELEADLAFAALRRMLAGRERNASLVRGEKRTHLAAEVVRRRVLGRFLDAWTSRWKARTDCRVGYVVDSCRQHAGPVKVEYPLSVDL